MDVYCSDFAHELRRTIKQLERELKKCNDELEKELAQTVLKCPTCDFMHKIKYMVLVENYYYNREPYSEGYELTTRHVTCSKCGETFTAQKSIIDLKRFFKSVRQCKK